LVKGEDVQDSALREDLMLIKGNQRAQAERRDFTQQDGVGWAVAFEHFERHNVFQGGWIFTLVTVFLLYYLAGFTKRQRFSLSEEVRQQFRMVIRQRVMGDRRG